ncbi:MAG: FKBP-type peptidyl-prolyl cis-trans isomerase [Jatrophihabitantaceae bacterium]
MTRRIAELAVALTATGCLAVLAGGCASSSSPTVKPATQPASPSTVSFNDVTVADASTLSSKPKVSSKSTTVPSALQVKDLVTGTGQAASPTSTVTVQYVGVRYADGKQFDASWDHGGATSFSLAQVVPGFTEGIGGTQGISAMKVGGRRLMILPASLGYGAQGTSDGSIPPNAPIVFVVDLVGVS